jgi:putative membrane protein
MPRLRHRAAVASIVGGLVGGLIGAGVMSVGHALMTAIAGDESAKKAGDESAKKAGDESAQRPKADQEEDATVKVANQVSRVVRGRPLAEHEKPMAGHVVHYGFGAAMGLVYGVAALVSPVVTAGAGTAYGVAVWLGAHATVVPMLGLAPSPLRQRLGKEVRELILHLAFGVTVALVRRVALRTSR